MNIAKNTRRAATALALTLAGALPALAGHQPVAAGQTVFIPPLSFELTPTETADPATTTAIVNAINEANAFCSSVSQPEYVVDCFAYQYEEIAKSLPTTGDYAEVRQNLADTAQKLEAVAQRSRSVAKPAARLSGGPSGVTTKRAIIPVETAALPQAREEAAQIIGEAATILLRSTENSDRRRAEFQRIAEAMQSGTILLRSL